LGAEKPLNGREMTSFGAKKPILGAAKPLNGYAGWEGCAMAAEWHDMARIVTD
jgi:hypothetical protein